MHVDARAELQSLLNVYSVPPVFRTMSATPLHRLADYLLLLLATVVGGYALLELRQPWVLPAGSNWPWCILIAAAVLGGIALRRMDSWLPDAQAPAHPAARPMSKQRNAGLVCLACAVALTAWVVARLWPNYREWQDTEWLWLLALLFVIAGGWLLAGIGEPAADELAANRQAAGSPPRVGAVPRWVEVCAFLGIAALAIFLRVYRLEQIPAGIYVDETNGALDSLYVLEGRPDSPFGTGWYETPNGYIFYMAALFKLFGANYYSLKAASVIPAVLTVLAVYPLGRVLFGPATAMSAMFLVAVSRWHLTMSRWGWNEVAPPVFQVLGTFFLVRGLRDRRGLDFAAGGLISGLMIYTYLSSRLALATLALFGVYWLLTDPDGPIRSWRRHWKGFVLFGLAAAIAMAPIAVTYLTDPFTFTNRMVQISVFNEVRDTHSYQPLIDNIVRHLKFFHQSGDMSGKHNFPGEPETDPVTGLLFVIGLAYGLMRLRDRRRGLLWIWMLLAMSAGVFSVRHEAPQAYRTLNAVPAIALLAGDVLTRCARGLLWLRPAAASATAPPARLFSTGAATLIVVSALAAAGAWEVSIYLGRQATSPSVQGSFNQMENWVSKEVLAALDRDTVVYLSPRFYDFSPLRFLVYGVVKQKTGRNTLEDRPYRLARPEVDLPVPDTGTDALFLLESAYWPLRDYFLSYYPSANLELVRDAEQRPLYVRAQIAEQALQAAQGLHARFTSSHGTVDERIVPQIDERWTQRDVTAAQWSGGLRAEESGTYDLVLHGDLKVVVDDQPWTGSRFLGSGLHSLEVTQPHCQRDGIARLGWTAPHASADPVPAQAFFRVGPPRHGLTAYYFKNEHWEGEPVFSQITPFFLLAWREGDPLLSPFSARFVGSLHIDRPGFYHFRIEADDGARLWLDHQVLGEGMIPLQPNRITALAKLDPGDHPIQIDYFQHGGSTALEFYWAPPDQPETLVPPSVLLPEHH